MLFYLCLLLDLFTAIAFGAYTGSFWIGLGLYAALAAAVTALFMGLGRSVQRVLKKKSTFFIIYQDDNIITGINHNTKRTMSIARSSIAEELYDYEELVPYFTIEALELTLFGRLISVREPKTVYKITLYHPAE